jgi:glyoxylate/hydroxypyruvate reductase A
MKIYVATPFGPDERARLLASAPDATFFFSDEWPDEARRLDELRHAEIVLGNPQPARWLAEARQARWVQLYSTGFEYYRGIELPAVVTNMQDYYSTPCAETAIAGILALYRRIDRLVALKGHGRWMGHALRPGMRLLHGRRVLILGFGHLGRRVADTLRGFGCLIRVFSRSAPEADVRAADQLLAEVRLADVVVGCLPGTPGTKALFTREMTRALHPEAVFCNMGRGSLLEDEALLVERLRNGEVLGAVLDVTAQEPIPPGDPLWDCPNLILTQHTGGGSRSEFEGIADFFLDNLDRYRQGDPLLSQVDLSKGH